MDFHKESSKLCQIIKNIRNFDMYGEDDKFESGEKKAFLRRVRREVKCEIIWWFTESKLESFLSLLGVLWKFTKRHTEYHFGFS